MSSNLQDDNQTGRQTGAGALFLNKVKLAAQQKITKANTDRTAALAAAHQQAQTALEVAQPRALAELSQNLRKIFLRVYNARLESSGSWLEVDPKGSIINSSLPFGYDAAFDEATQHVYFSVVKRRFPEGRSDVCWHLVSARMDGTDVKTLGTRFMRNEQNGGVAFDEKQGAIFWIGGDGVILRTQNDISGSSTSQVLDIDPNAVGQPDLPSCLALDKVRQKIYWAYSGMLGVVNYDGSNAKLLFNRGHFYAQWVTSLTVDSKLERLCWINNGLLHKSTLDGSGVSRSIWELAPRTSTSFEYVALDTSSQVLYSFRDVGAGASEFKLFLAAIDSDRSRDGSSAGEFKINSLRMYEKADFSLITGRWLGASRVVLITSADEVNQKLSSATAKLNTTRIAAPQQIAQAHLDAAQTRQRAHSALEAAHAKAASDITAKQQEAVTRRQDAQNRADATHAQAAQAITTANQDATTTVQQAHNRAQSILDAKQQEADAIKQPAQEKLDSARIAQQNS